MCSRAVGDIFKYDYPTPCCSTCWKKRTYPCASSGPIADDLPCPCTNRCQVFRQPRPYDLSLMYPKCVDRPPTPHFVTPLYNEPTPYIKWSSTSPETRTMPFKCRVPFSEHLKSQCPNSAPNIGPNLVMFFQCSDPKAICNTGPIMY